jgi:hypothetical protein
MHRDGGFDGRPEHVDIGYRCASGTEDLLNSPGQGSHRGRAANA